MDILDFAEKILENDPDVIIPVRKLWVLSCLAAGTDAGAPAIEEFTEALARDDRFDFLTDEWPDIANEFLQEAALPGKTPLDEYGPGKRVKLRRTKITPGLLAGIMHTKVNAAIDVLMQAWEKRPAGDPETEDQLLQILLQAKKLRQDLEELMREERAPGDETSDGE